ncbi:MAG: ABC-F family ATP-binding cassette domain-containing protein [Lachnospiraceae bacterium]|nr:ABC-F family ATP-binding cassette domain-containing protein [Lachnospiraceae bacterium]
MILSVNNITKSFGTDVILSEVSFHIEAGQKAAIVGINGAGKSTLLKIITGELAPDSGTVSIQKDATIGILTQTQNLTDENSIYDEVLSVKADILALEENIRRTEHSLKNLEGEELEQALNRYSRMNAEFENANGYAVKSEVTGVLKGLGFGDDEFSKTVGTLSGGQKTRVALAKLLLSKPDIIMLDEPTNHLDMDAIRWLEGFLGAYKGAVILVAHDRYFLDKIVSKVVEIENTKATSYEGNYTEFSKKKKMLRDALIKQYLNQQRDIKHQEAVIEKLKSFNREKSIKRAESREKQLAKIERIELPKELNAEMDIRLEPNIESGNDVLTVRGLAKGFDGVNLFRNVDLEVKKGDKVAIIGANGTGKTTLMKILNGLLEPDAGSFKLGAKVYTGYYDQEHHVLNPEKTVFEEIQDTYPDMDNTKVRNVLAAFLFTGDDVFKLIRDLSGGEKGRVSLAKLMLSDANLLFLDEPTNHLDIISKEILEQAVSSYKGTVVYVSHDRYFINKTATRIMELVNNGFLCFDGTYDYYLEKRDALLKLHEEKQAAGNSVSGFKPTADPGQMQGGDLSDKGQGAFTAQNSKGSKEDWENAKKKQAETRKLENEFKKCEEEINRLETRNSEIDEEMQKPEVASSAARLLELSKEHKANTKELERLMEVWEELYERLNS